VEHNHRILGVEVNKITSKADSISQIQSLSTTIVEVEKLIRFQNDDIYENIILNNKFSQCKKKIK